MRHDRADPSPPEPDAPCLMAEALPERSDAAEVLDLQAEQSERAYNRVGSARYLRASLALLLAGFATFSLLYCPQPLLPTLARSFGIGAAASSLTISLCTGLLAALDRRGGNALRPVGPKSRDRRRPLVTAAALNAAVSVAPNWTVFLLLRALEGLALGGVPAVAMTYLAEETDPKGLGFAMGIYVGSTAVGGMGGRVITGLVASWISWRAAIGAIGVLGLVAGLGVLLLLPASRHFHRRPLRLRHQAEAFRQALRHPRLLATYGFAFLMMGGFVAVYNYAGFRLEDPPYRLDQAQEGLIFTLYLLGTASSALAGTMADRFGRAPVMMVAVMLSLLGIMVSLFVPLTAVVLGIALVTLGFFAAHAVASGSLGGLAWRREGPGGFPLPAELLRRIEPARDGRRLVLDDRALARGRGLCGGVVRCGPGACGRVVAGHCRRAHENRRGCLTRSVCSSASVFMSASPLPSASAASSASGTSTTMMFSCSAASPPPGPVRSAAR